MAGRVIQISDENGQPRILGQQPAQGIGRNQRHIAIQHQHPRTIGDLLDHLLHGVAGA